MASVVSKNRAMHFGKLASLHKLSIEGELVCADKLLKPSACKDLGIIRKPLKEPRVKQVRIGIFLDDGEICLLELVDISLRDDHTCLLEQNGWGFIWAAPGMDEATTSGVVGSRPDKTQLNLAAEWQGHSFSLCLGIVSSTLAAGKLARARSRGSGWRERAGRRAGQPGVGGLSGG